MALCSKVNRDPEDVEVKRVPRCRLLSSSQRGKHIHWTNTDGFRQIREIWKTVFDTLLCHLFVQVGCIVLALVFFCSACSLTVFYLMCS